MGLGDLVDKAKSLISGNKDAVKEGIDKAGDIVDEKTDAKFADKVDQGQEAANDFVEGLDED